MKRALVVVMVSGCVTASLRERATTLEREAPACSTFSAFDERLAKERARLDAAPAADLVPASQSLSSARRACAKAVIGRIQQQQEREGREAAVAEVEAITRALGVEDTTTLLRAAWGHEADGFLAEVVLAGVKPKEGPSPPAPVEPTVPRHEQSGAAHFEPSDATAVGAAGDCLRRAPIDAATCLTTWRREGAEEQDFERALTKLVATVKHDAALLDDEARAELLGEVLRALALPRERATLEPLFASLASLTDAMVTRAAALTGLAGVGKAGALVRPLLVVDASRRRVERFAAAASLEHARLAAEAGPRAHAAQVHRALSAWFLAKDVTRPALEPGRWDDLRWSCELSKPALPTLPPGVSARLVGRCRKLPKTNTQANLDPSMRTNDLELSLDTLRVDADVTLTCGGAATAKHLTLDEVVVDRSESDLAGTRQTSLESALQVLVTTVERDCRAQATKDAGGECGRLEGEPLDVTQTFTGLALRLGAWPPCFSSWFTRRYGVAPPALSGGASSSSASSSPAALAP
jgi:hypothetical protein